ncbi:DNA phosphorothioation-dependent restriction protein DptG [Paenibacillus sp. CFBP13512]|uniref:DNA phosphorothioation-dependent restriction protein DptG n=1 Tax=Paenibacillus sp. CFBP13512 TaxID=2184007 RepID=UPI0013762A03|nr:DNA phosphorothioation-dependent restriction protein DptG [Paenibacillus sp. CFBP13512]
MSYQINIEAIRNKFKFDSSIKHNPKIELELLPYITKFKDTHYNFREVTGEFIRSIGKKKLAEVVDTDQLINKVIDSIDFQDINQRSEFKQMLKTLFLDESNQLYLFHPQTLYYINTEGNENKRLAIFLYNILWGSENAWIIEADLEEYSDLMSKLLFRALPQLTDNKIKNKNYISMLPEISQLFRQDFKWLATKNELFTTQVEKLIAYYYFFYITQFSIRNESLFKPIEKDIRPVYFTFENEERLSKTRISYEYGWKSLEKLINRTFSHINFLKMLNLNDSNNESQNEQDTVILSYQKITEEIYLMSPEEQDILDHQVSILIEEYKEKLSHDSKWGLLGTISEPYDLPVLNRLYLLFNMIDHQFNQTSRSKPYNEYKQWFVHFCQKTFLKSRGRSGKMLILDTDYLLFLTKLMIKDESKIRLKNLFSEFEIRGIIFDRDTQEAIVDYFEKLNLLEKKSDSGDAIYVKAFL